MRPYVILGMLGSPPGRRMAHTILRFALAAAFLSAVADRFGLWGAPGTEGVVWGSYDEFLSYTHLLLSVLPRAVSDWLGTLATGAELLLSVWLVSGIRARWAGACSAGLLLLFATAMVFAIGPKPVLDYSVLTAFAGSLVLAAEGSERHTGSATPTMESPAGRPPPTTGSIPDQSTR